jgi:uncharacterized protein
VATAITELGVGEALVSFLDAKGRPEIVERAFVIPPASQIGPIDAARRTALLTESIVAGVYEKTIDRESAYEVIKGRTQTRQGGGTETVGGSASPGQSPATAGAAQEEPGLLDKIGGIFGGGGGGTGSVRGASRREGIGEAMAKSAARAIGSQVGREILRGVLGSILGGGKRR